MNDRARRFGHFIGMLPVALLSAERLGAQATAPAASTRCGPEVVLPPIVKGALCAARWALDNPLRPIVRGIAPGGGIGAGFEFDAPIRGGAFAEASGTVTVREYWSGQIGAGYRGRRARVEAYARYRDMKQLSFFGIGPESDETDHTNFRLQDRVAGALASVRITPWLTLGGRVEGLWPDAGGGHSSKLPSIETGFTEPTAPGLSEQPRMMRYQSSLDIQIPAAVGEQLYQGTRLRVGYAVYSDRELDRFSFRRIELEAQQRFALFGPSRRLTLHGWVSMTNTDAGHEVPFYLQHTLGGKWNLRSVHEDLIGSDGSQATLRGFRNFRFRDRNLLLLQAEYRIPVWGPVDATVFFDAGKVTSHRSELDLRDLKHNGGFSLSVMRGPLTAARVDVGLGGEEGLQLFVTIRREIVP
jgi:hypothetical protein